MHNTNGAGWGLVWGGDARTDALEVGELRAAAAQQGDDAAVVDGDEHNDGDGIEQRQRGARDHKTAPEHDPVHRRALHHEEAAHLAPAQPAAPQKYARIHCACTCSHARGEFCRQTFLLMRARRGGPTERLSSVMSGPLLQEKSRRCMLHLVYERTEYIEGGADLGVNGPVEDGGEEDGQHAHHHAHLLHLLRCETSNRPCKPASQLL